MGFVFRESCLIKLWVFWSCDEFLICSLILTSLPNSLPQISPASLSPTRSSSYITQCVILIISLNKKWDVDFSQKETMSISQQKKCVNPPSLC